MESQRLDEKQGMTEKGSTILVAVDFSPCSLLALRKAKSVLGQKPARILVLHVIEEDFIQRCVRHGLGPEEDITKKLFLRAKERLHNVLRQEGMDGEGVEGLVSEGTPYLEINKKAIQSGADMVVMGCRGNSGDMNTIFFGSTTERVLRFIKRPVLCVPENEGNKLD
ncbi:MAG: universal stress protein [Desulfobacteraceae bacterium]|nr:MAG: universal stress protein [Desulfobacteraceae bacterium]